MSFDPFASMADSNVNLASAVVHLPSHKEGRALVALFIVDDFQVVRSWVIGHVERRGRRAWDAFCPKTDLAKVAGDPLVDADFDHERFVRQYEADDWLVERFNDRLTVIATTVGGDA
jgi:hypothetical protein